MLLHLSGRRFGRLSVLRLAGKTAKRRRPRANSPVNSEAAAP
jgi:hypothetical protein